MDGMIANTVPAHLAAYAPASQRILDVQKPDGAIPWFEQGPWDPWNHVESAMALTATGAIDQAIRAYDFLFETQRGDGAWLGEYGNALPMKDRVFISREKAPAVLDANFCAYPAVGVLHFWLTTGAKEQIHKWWPMVEAAIEFVLTLQRRDGSISWAFEAVGTKDDDALLAGNASIAKSLECAIALAEIVGADVRHWSSARDRLIEALLSQPEAFDRRKTGARFAMDWYYPILSGVLDPDIARQRLQDRWGAFVLDGVGCRCVSDEPWITVAETCELVLTLASIGEIEPAEILLSDIDRQRDAAGVFWMGWQDEEQIMWPQERPTWTQGAVILAVDALYGSGKASRLLTTSASKLLQKA